MIAGHNFNGNPIPEPLRKRFKKVLPDGSWLAGVATTAAHRDIAVVTADNGNRKITVVEARDHLGPIYGIYVKGSMAGGLGESARQKARG